MKPQALFDLDSTLVDFQRILQQDMTALASPGEPEFTHQGEQDMSPHVRARYEMIKRQPGWWVNLPRYDLGFELLCLFQRTHKIHILTRASMRNPSCWGQKIEWCNRELPGIKVTITTKKELVMGDVLVDDWVGYVGPWLKKNPTSKAILPAWPWNEGFSHPRALRFTASSVGEREIETINNFLLSPCGVKQTGV